jgi:DNA-binding NtrC family response regulator
MVIAIKYITSLNYLKNNPTHGDFDEMRCFMNSHMKTVLILDNETPVSWALKSLLSMDNYQVYTASTLEEASLIFSDRTLSALITEYRLNNSQTIDMIKEIKFNRPEIYVMMLTNEEIDEQEYEQIIRAGVDDYFLKPVPLNRVLLHLDKGLKQREGRKPF